MRLICYPTCVEPPKIVPASGQREWMDATPSRHANRCLPLSIANAHGWLILNTCTFEAVWDGGAGHDAVTVRSLEPDRPLFAKSHFGSGTMTFDFFGLFRTEPGYDLIVTGPTNEPKDAIQPLTAIVETDWLPFTFPMTWRFTRPDTPVTFLRDEPFCMIYPVMRSVLDDTVPEFRRLDSDPEFRDAFREFSGSRQNFERDLQVPGSEANKMKWQKHYTKGTEQFATAPKSHRTKLSLRPFSWR